jgi:hypothetical protein
VNDDNANRYGVLCICPHWACVDGGPDDIGTFERMTAMAAFYVPMPHSGNDHTPPIPSFKEAAWQEYFRILDAKDGDAARADIAAYLRFLAPGDPLVETAACLVEGKKAG